MSSKMIRTVLAVLIGLFVIAGAVFWLVSPVGLAKGAVQLDIRKTGPNPGQHVLTPSDAVFERIVSELNQVNKKVPSTVVFNCPAQIGENVEFQILVVTGSGAARSYHVDPFCHLLADDQNGERYYLPVPDVLSADLSALF